MLFDILSKKSSDALRIDFYALYGDVSPRPRITASRTRVMRDTFIKRADKQRSERPMVSRFILLRNLPYLRNLRLIHFHFII